MFLPRNIFVVFGGHDLDDQIEVGRFTRSPSRIFVHDDWNPETVKFDTDIAMLLMPEKNCFLTFSSTDLSLGVSNIVNNFN